MRPPRSARIGPGIKSRRRFQLLVSEELPNHLIGPLMRVQVNLRREMSELVRGHFHTNVFEHRALD
jgi:hypothetical protein